MSLLDGACAAEQMRSNRQEYWPRATGLMLLIIRIRYIMEYLYLQLDQIFSGISSHWIAPPPNRDGDRAMPNAKLIAPIAGRRSSRRDDPLV